jgi:hypothetical protein
MTRRKFRADDPGGVLYGQFMGSSWAAFISWAHSEPDARKAFTEETGIPWPIAPKSALGAMIDAATGYQDHALFMFAQWATVNHFGLEYAPAAFQAACRERPLPGKRS